jgi:hypothetical protein
MSLAPILHTAKKYRGAQTDRNQTLITKNKGYVQWLLTNITLLSLGVANVPMKETKDAGT